METTQTTPDRMKITLTARRPVSIDPEAWPVIAIATDKEFDNQYEFQANRISNWTLIVRQHARGCSLVYGIYTYDSQYRGARCYDIRGGQKLAPGADLVQAIAAVAEWMASAVEAERPEDSKTFYRLANECIADLPAEDCDCDHTDLI